MALADILTSLHGRRLGLDKSGFLHGQDQELHVASTLANIPPGGITVLSGTTAQPFTIDKPVPGLRKTLVATGTSTARTITTPSGVTITSTGSPTSTNNTITMLTAGQTLDLIGLSTAVYLVTGNHGAVTFSLV